MELQVDTLNQALIYLAKALSKEGNTRSTRSYDCRELAEPVLIRIKNPTQNVVTLPERGGNWFLPFSESLWIAQGSNVLEEGPGHYVKSLYNFSDDGKTWRAGYGPRLRRYGADSIDQLRFVFESFERDPHTRQAVISIADPTQDCFVDGVLLTTKDIPCTRSLHFMERDGKLDLTVHMRSNDLIWGFSSVNVSNFTRMQHYVAQGLGLPVGEYWHIADNLHYYSRHEELVKNLASLDPCAEKVNRFNWFSYKVGAKLSFEQLLRNLQILSKIETSLKEGVSIQEVLSLISALEGVSPFWEDWAVSFVIKHAQLRGIPSPVGFWNPASQWASCQTEGRR